jgi:uncharacterized membrane protein (UPF0127 family)
MTCAFNRTRGTCLATNLAIARTHWSRFRGLMGASATSFPIGCGLWIIPSHGIHTMAMRFAIDALYLDSQQVVIHVEEHLEPWRLAAVRMHAASVMEFPVGTVKASSTAIGDQIDVVEQSPIHTEAA